MLVVNHNYRSHKIIPDHGLMLASISVNVLLNRQGRTGSGLIGGKFIEDGPVAAEGGDFR